MIFHDPFDFAFIIALCLPNLVLAQTKQKVSLKQLKVLGEETVTVAGGSFDTFKVELRSDDDHPTFLWIAKETRKMVKVTAILKEMGGAKLTTEIAK